MSIRYIEKERLFQLDTLHSSYQMKVDFFGFLVHLYYGRKTQGSMEYLLDYEDRGFSGNPYDVGIDRTYSMDILPQEYPTYGTGDYRNTALVLRNHNGSWALDLRYQGHEIKPGKYGLKGLPAVYASEEEAMTLIIHMADPVNGVEVDLLYGVLPAYDIITRSAIIKNASGHSVTLEKVQTACLDFVAGDYDLISFQGRHCMERGYQRNPIGHQSSVIGSRRGTSSHQYSPMIVVAEKDSNEKAGVCYGLSFVYSGGFQAEAEKDQVGGSRILLGLQEELFSYPLEPGDAFCAPEVIMTYSGEGFSRMSHNLHRCIRHHICRGKYQYGSKQVLLNSWEGCYFDFTGEDIYQLALEAKELGMDMLVMDDGWFGKRDDDYAGLGDWYVNEEKLGESIGSLSKRVTDLGIRFGIWFEPECINEDSDLFRAHPDWALCIPGRNPVRARYQLVLDFSRKEVVDYIFEQVCKVLDEGEISYVKWDFNRSIHDIYSHTAKDQGKVLYDYVLGLYDFLERLLTRYPDLLLEGCSGGGGRYDAGMMYYCPQIWCSDNTDAIDRLSIQYGSSFGFPISTVGSHVSAVPNHQTGRITPLHTRAVVAMSGTFGYELNPARMTAEEKAIVKEQIKEYKKYADLISDGDYYRLSNPLEDPVAAWCFVSEDKKEVLVNAVIQEIHGNPLCYYIKLMGLEEGAFYKDEASGKIYPANALMEMGMPLPVDMCEYPAYQTHLTSL